MATTSPELYLDKALALLDWPSLSPWIDAVETRIGAQVSIAHYKMLLLERWFQLSSAALDDACHRRAAFRRFLGAPIHGPVAEVAMHRQLRPRLAIAGTEVGKLIAAIELLLSDRGLPPPDCAWTGREPTIMGVPEEGAQTSVLPTGAAQARIAVASGHAPDGSQPRGSTSGAGHVRSESAERARAVLVWPWGVVTPVDRRICVGRDPEFCPLARQLWADPQISRRHAELEPDSMGTLLRDLGATNGTYVDGEALPRHGSVVLQRDASIRFGPELTVELLFSRVNTAAGD